MKPIILNCIFLTIFLVNCKNKNSSKINIDNIDSVSLTTIEDTDTLVLKQIPEQINQWLKYYQQFDSNFTINQFIASGVALHIDDLPDAFSKENENEMADFFRYSPDSSKYVDLVSYNYFRVKNKLFDGEIDQQVVLYDKFRKLKKQLMFNGPNDLAECADWIGPSALLIGVSHKNSTNDTINAEIFMFQLNDSTYTNFSLNHTVYLDSNQLLRPNFLKHFFSLHNLLTQ